MANIYTKFIRISIRDTASIKGKKECLEELESAYIDLCNAHATDSILVENISKRKGLK